MRIIVLSAFLLSATMGIAQKADPATYAKTITMGDLKNTSLLLPDQKWRAAKQELKESVKQPLT